jgi:RimJ/RimL family protein N-acetyltransferase
MAMTRDYRFTTDRLIINEWKSLTSEEWPQQNIAGVVLDILTEPVTQSLPPAWQGAYTADRAQQWVRERDAEGVTLLAVERVSKAAIGMVILFEPENSGHLRLGYMLAESAWGKGFASELVAGFVEWCRQHNIKTVTGGVEPDNVASRRVLEKCGFIAEPGSGQSEEQLFKIVLSAR